MTSQGAPLARFQRALASGNHLLIDAAARELPRVTLDQAFTVCLAFLGDEQRYQRALVRWHARFCLEQRPGVDEAQLVLAALQALPGPAAAAAAEALLEVLGGRRLTDAERALESWLETRRG